MSKLPQKAGAQKDLVGDTDFDNLSDHEKLQVMLLALSKCLFGSDHDKYPEKRELSSNGQ